jgi:hypothetical protein
MKKTFTNSQALPIKGIIPFYPANGIATSILDIMGSEELGSITHAYKSFLKILIFYSHHVNLIIFFIRFIHSNSNCYSVLLRRDKWSFREILFSFDLY